MQTTVQHSDVDRYARCVEISKRARWDIDREVSCARSRPLDRSDKFLPDGLSMAQTLDFLNEDEQRFASRIQGRTYANMFGLVERFIGAKILELSRDHWLGDQTASRPSFASPTRSSSTRRCSAGSKP